MHLQSLLNNKTVLSVLFLSLSSTALAQGNNEFGYPVVPDTTSSINAPVGSIDGSFSVSATGGATYTIPIDVPKGVANSEPSLAIIYNSQSGNGVAGFGCSISGLSVITRVPSDIYHDGKAEGRKFAIDGRYSLDGQRLIKTSDLLNGDSVAFCLENDPFIEVVLHGIGGLQITSQLSMWFSVRTSDGMYREYGHSAESKQSFFYDGVNLVESWYLSSETNPCGIARSYSYANWDNSLYLQNISYGSNVVRFNYQQRSDTIRGAILGIPVLVARRLNTITSATIVGENDIIYRRYALHYTNSDQTTTGYSRLDCVTVSNGDGEELLPTTMIWNIPDSFSCQKETPNLYYNYLGTERSDIALFSADFNGDGLADIAQYGRTHQSYGSNNDFNYIQVHYGQIGQNGATSFQLGELVNLGNNMTIGLDEDHIGWNQQKTSPVAFDIDADGKAELLVPEYYFSIDGSYFGFWAYKNGETIGGVKYGDVHTSNAGGILWTAGDFDNDGIVEFVVLEKTSDGSAYYGAIMGGYQQPGNPHEYYTKYFRFSIPSVPIHIFASDMNCDGMTDLIAFYNQGYSVFYNNGTWLDDHLVDNSASPYYPSVTNYSLNIYPSKAWQGDFNGDGIPDFIVCAPEENNFYYELGNGNGTLNQQVAIALDNIYDQQTAKDDHKFFCQIFDMDGDGKSDVVVHKSKYNGPIWAPYHDRSYVYWLRSDGARLVIQSETSTTSEVEGEQRYYTVGDFNGDGMAELAAYSFDCYDGTESSIAFRIYKNGNHHSSSGKVVNVADGLNRQTNVCYSANTDSSVRMNSQVNVPSFPVVNVSAPLSVVSSVSSDNGAAGRNKSSYRYGKLLAHLQGRGMMGMTSSSVEDSITGMQTKSVVTQWHPDVFVPLSATEINTQDNHSDTVTTTHSVYIPQNGRACYWQRPSSIRHKDFDGNVETTQFTYLDYYGVVRSIHHVYSDGSSEMENYTDYDWKGKRYLPRTKESIRKHQQDNSSHTVWTDYVYNHKGLIDSIYVNLYTDYPVIVTTYTYDTYGNPLSKKVKQDNLSLTTDTWQYDSSHRFVTKHVQNGITDTRYTHDFWGNILTETDRTRSAHPLTQTYTYDGWGRQTGAVSPIGLRTAYKYGWGPSQSMRWFTVEQGDAQPWVKTWYDSMGRKVKSESIGSLNIPVSNTITYNNKGQVSSEKSRQGDIVTTSNYTYDYQGRVLTTTLTDSLGTLNQSLSYEYGSNWKSETRDGRTTKTIFDSWGNPITVITPQDTVSYTYNSQGKPISVTSCGRTVTMEYDHEGNQTRLTDPDAGTMTYTYDGLGRIISQTNARNQTQTYTYDSNGRIKSGPVGGSTSVSYTYGTTTSNKGQLLTEAVGSARKTTYQYDNYGRVIREARYSYRQGYRYFYFTYNSLNQLATQTYPNGITVSYQYDAYGNHVGTMKGDTVIWRLESSTGNTMQHQLCNSFHRQTAVNAMGLPTAKSIAFGNTQKHSMTFTYDASKGNLTQRTGMLNVAENFAYDNQERLTGTTAGGDSLSFNYAANGNISSKTGIGNYYYESAKPHAVTSIDNDHWQVPERTQKISYNAMGKVTSIIEEGRDTLNTINYGPDGERWTSTFKENGYQVTTLYLGDYEERIDSAGTESICYLDGGVLAVRHADGTQNIYVTYTDHLGSITRIYDEAGQEKFKASYDAWGYQTVYHNDINFYRGYTGHEMLPEFGLINMNGRLYDPLLGRFLSTDDFVQAPYDSQSFNRYSYCLNNPLKYTDPDGEIAWFLAGAIIGGAINLGIKAYNGQIHSITDGLVAFGIGAVAGAAGAWCGAYAFTAAGGAAGGAGGFVAGFASGTSSSAIAMPIENIGNHLYFGDPIMSEEEYLTGIAISGGIGGTINGISAIKNGNSFISGQPKANVEITLRKVDPVSVTSDYPLTLRKESDNINWPNPDYVDGTKVNYTITEGTHLDRYAFDKTHANNGTYFSTPEVPFEMRSLPYTKENYKHFEYKVIKPLPGTKSLARPYFNQPGMGFQFQAHPIPGTEKIPSALQLEKAGYIKLIIHF